MAWCSLSLLKPQEGDAGCSGVQPALICQTLLAAKGLPPKIRLQSPRIPYFPELLEDLAVMLDRAWGFGKLQRRLGKFQVGWGPAFELPL